MPSPKPKSSKLKALQGNPGKRKLNDKEPQYESTAGAQPPEDIALQFNSYAWNEWNRLVPELEVVGVLTSVDIGALANYCLAYSQVVEAQQLINLNGLFYTTTTKDGAEMQRKSPMIEVLNLGMRNMLSFGGELGLTPASRSRLKVEKAADEDPMERLLRGVD